MFRLGRLISVPSRVARNFGPRFSSFPGIHNQVNERTSVSEGGYIATPPFLAQYYAVYKNWHRIRVAVPAVWSCDWRRWDNGPLIPYLEKQVAWLYGVSMPVEPMAFFAGQCEPMFLFFAGGEYYFYNMGALTRFEEHFTSHEDFLRRFGKYLDSGAPVPNVWHQ
ncbi:hypothetical protein B0H14DRAFT_3068228 [Mycena olivaceomarginata]|nr:hypothetical protein B0H14DRAFT_3068228 [Mycena olivaceomarginata]